MAQTRHDEIGDTGVAVGLADPDDTAEARLLEQLADSARTDAARYATDLDRLHELVTLTQRRAGADGIERYLALDVAGTLRIGQQAADRRLRDAERFHTALPHTLARLRTGRLLVSQARIVLQETQRCSEQVAADAERRLLTDLDDHALRGLIGGKLVRRSKRAVLQAEAALEPHQTEQREADAREGRRVTVRAEPDAMGSLWALLPADQLRQFTLGLDELTRRQKQADTLAGLARTADQRRADLLALLPALALLALDGTTPTPDGAHPAVVVQVHVPMATALGLTDDPGHLDGYGPLSAGTVRLMLPDAHLRRVIVDTRTGEPVHVASDTTSADQQQRRERRAAAGTGRSQQREPTHPSDQQEQRHQPDLPDKRDERDERDERDQGGLPERTDQHDRADRAGEPQQPGRNTQCWQQRDRPDRDGEPGPRTQSRQPCDQRQQPDGPETPEGPPSVPRPEPGPPLTHGLPDGPLRRALLAMVPDQPLLLPDVPEPQYEPSRPLARLVRTRDAHCTGIGCDRPAAACDLDHRDPWPLGPTSAGNLASVSRRCHQAKTRSWRLHRHPDGSSTWTSPTGRSYPTPAPWDPPPDLSARRSAPPPDDELTTRAAWPTRPPTYTDDELTPQLPLTDGPSQEDGCAPGPSRVVVDPVPPPF